MPKELKVYSWTSHRPEARKPGSHHAQTREVMAAYSAAEVKRKHGLTRADWEHSGGETGNAEECELALSEPGETFWKNLNDAMRGVDDWRRNDGSYVVKMTDFDKGYRAGLLELRAILVAKRDMLYLQGDQAEVFGYHGTGVKLAITELDELLKPTG